MTRYTRNKCHMKTVFHQLTQSEGENMRIKLGFPMVSCHRKHKRVGAALIAAAGLTWIFIKLVATLTSSNAGYIIHESLIIFFNIKYHNSPLCDDECQMSKQRPCHWNKLINTIPTIKLPSTNFPCFPCLEDRPLLGFLFA